MGNWLSRALVMGLVMALGAVGLFLLLYFVVLANMADLLRLLVSLVAPPIVMLVLLGIYYVLTQDEKS
ncbi:MAG: hypothetical protein ACFE0Q_06610 [Anaerolineae bacterium]